MSDRPQPLRAVVVGLGIMGSHHLRVLRGLEDVEVVAAVDPAPERRRVEGVPSYGSLAEALSAGAAPHFACVAVPAARLAPVAHEALAAGLHVLVEKPMATTVEEAAALVDDAAARGLTLGVGLVERFNPAVQALKRKIDEGVAGRIYQVHARRLSPFPDRDAMLGVALDLAAHDIDVMRFVLGDEVERVYAETAQRQHRTVEDLLCATLRFAGDATGLLEVNWLTPAKVRELSVTGEDGMFSVDYLTQDLRFYERPARETNQWDALAEMRGPGEGDMIRFALMRREPLRQQWEAFVQALRAGAPAPVGGEDGIAALATALAVRESAARQEVVRPARRAARVA
jgi:UDP-N-acetylglucosamine 3-dehydrogenase